MENHTPFGVRMHRTGCRWRIHGAPGTMRKPRAARLGLANRNAVQSSTPRIVRLMPPNPRRLLDEAWRYSRNLGGAVTLTGPDSRPLLCRAHISGSPDRWVESYVSSLRRGHDDRRDARLRACWDLPAGRFPRRAVFQDPSIGNAPGLSMLCARRRTVDSMGGSPDRPIE